MSSPVEIVKKEFFSCVVASQLAGLILEPLDLRLEFSLVLADFCGGLQVMYTRCSIKCA
jgi:hypothetical protein